MADPVIGPVPLADVWTVRSEVMYPDAPPDFVRLPNDEAGLHWGLFHEGQLVTVVSLFPADGELQFRKFATRQAWQGKGFGKQMLSAIMDWAEQNGITKVWCNARLSATGLYEQFGMQPHGEAWERDGHRFIKMSKKLT